MVIHQVLAQNRGEQREAKDRHLPLLNSPNPRDIHMSKACHIVHLLIP